jgi:nicotinamidase-related amidase
MKQIFGRQVLDTLPELVDPRRTAVLAVDIQNDFCHPKGHLARYGNDVMRMSHALLRMLRFVAEAQALGMRVVFLRYESPDDRQLDPPAWLRFKTRDGKAPDITVPGTWGWQFLKGIDVRPQDVVVRQSRPDGFLGTNLDQVLRAQGIESVIVLGATTEGCVESTVRAASYHDYYVVVLADAVASPNAELHDGSLRLLRARYPTHTADEALDAIREAQLSARAAA